MENEPMRPQFVALGLATLLLTVETATVLQAPFPPAQAFSAFAAIEPAQTKPALPATDFITLATADQLS